MTGSVGNQNQRNNSFRREDGVVLLNRAPLVLVHPEVKNWIKYARFEDKHGYIAHSRRVYERAVEFYSEEHVDETLFVAFARFEEMQKEVGREKYIVVIDRNP